MKIEKVKWLKSIPESQSHGTGTFQKRLWKVISDYIRIRDFYKYKSCISCGKMVLDWRDTDWQAGHYHPYSVCKGYSKFAIDNVFGQCSYCNRGFNGAPAGAMFKDMIIARYGEEHLKKIERYKYQPPEKIEDNIIVEKIKEVLELMKDLPEKPDYYDRVMDKLLEENML